MGTREGSIQPCDQAPPRRPSATARAEDIAEAGPALLSGSFPATGGLQRPNPSVPGREGAGGGWVIQEGFLEEGLEEARQVLSSSVVPISSSDRIVAARRGPSPTDCSGRGSMQAASASSSSHAPWMCPNRPCRCVLAPCAAGQVLGRLVAGEAGCSPCVHWAGADPALSKVTLSASFLPRRGQRRQGRLLGPFPHCYWSLSFGTGGTHAQAAACLQALRSVQEALRVLRGSPPGPVPLTGRDHGDRVTPHLPG